MDAQNGRNGEVAVKSLKSYLADKSARHTIALNELYNIEDIGWEINVTTEVEDEAFRHFLSDLNDFCNDWVQKNCTEGMSYFNDE